MLHHHHHYYFSVEDWSWPQILEEPAFRNRASGFHALESRLPGDGFGQEPPVALTPRLLRARPLKSCRWFLLHSTCSESPWKSDSSQAPHANWESRLESFSENLAVLSLPTENQKSRKFRESARCKIPTTEPLNRKKVLLTSEFISL